MTSIIRAFLLTASASALAMAASAQESGSDTREQRQMRLATEMLQQGEEEAGLNLLELLCLGDTPGAGDDFACFIFFSHFADNPAFPAIEANEAEGTAGIERYQSLGLTLCSEGNPKGCSRLYSLYSKFDSPEAAQNKLIVLDAGCSAGDALQCDLLASTYFAGAGVPVDLDAGRDALTRSCELDNREACAQLAQYLSDGQFGRIGDNVITDFAIKACPDTGANECVTAAALVKKHGLPGQLPYVRKMLSSACYDYAQKDGCLALIEDWQDNTTGPENATEAQRARDHACKIGIEAMCG